MSASSAEPSAASAPLPTETLQAFASALSPDRILAAALEVDRARTDELDARLLAWHGFRAPGLIVTPFEAQVALCAREAGVFAFNRQEREFLPAPASWRHHELAASQYETGRGIERLLAGQHWPFHQDCPVADWELSAAPRWWSHGLVHAMLGFGWWTELTEWESMHMARLGEVVAALHWYWLGELGRSYCAEHSIRSGDATPSCPECEALEKDAGRAEVRAERIEGEQGRLIAANAVEVLGFEVACFRSGVYGGQIVVPPPGYLGVGEACEYARVHQRRLESPAMARYVERCLRPGLDYATSPADFERRCAELLSTLLTPAAPSATRRAARAMTVLRDVGARLCHAAALRAEAGGGADHERGLRAVGDALARLYGGVEEEAVEGVLGAALAEVAADLVDAGGAPGVETVGALGYRPTTTPEAEPEAFRAARHRALWRRAFHLHPIVGVAARELQPVAARVLDEPRGPAVVAELFEAAMAASEQGEISDMAAAFVGYAVVVVEAWEGLDFAYGLGQRWYYRLASRRVPPDAEAHRWHILRNPYLSELPAPFELGWLEQVLGARVDDAPTGGFEPRATTSVRHLLAGAGRERPVVLAATEARQRLHSRAFHAPTVRELLDEGRLGREALQAALDEELVLCLHLDNPYARWPRPADLRYADVDEADADS
ncbi:MAG: hypothetical protein H6744_20000 [Deltaproteobacteria bacterium]|nr:hypothetical protein [Deltaproteobacteria bacterium]MCB9788967.1 hypothetical protein [Deltaproteobacteria bacterium]